MKKRSLIGLREFGLIDVIKKSVPVGKEVIKGIGDDTAVLPLNRKKHFLLTTDMLIENVHFTKKDNYKLIGQKALAVNISDIAAMGGVPKFAVVSLGVSKNTCLHAIKDIYRGINGLAKKFGVSVVGGDTVSSEKLVINITLTGEVEKKNLVLRCGAKAKDKIFVTGSLGRSLKTGKHLKFTPRTKEAQILVKSFKPTAMIDVSDGLVADLNHILEQSKLGAILDEASIPRNPRVTLAQALYDGEDFELIFTVSPQKAKKLFRQKKLKCFCVGEVTTQKGVWFKCEAGKIKRTKVKGYQHL
ncbi:MAG: thiamine-phosphate kinase [Candidatus Aceula meridiana]|nr:thiamine-phosphate kinase [Candidatus Aceula meridiana]